MSGDDWKTLRVPPEAYDEAKAQKESEGRTWGQQVVRDTDDGDRQQTIDVEDARLLSQHVERSVAPYFADLAGVDDTSEIRDAEVGGPAVDTDALAREVARQLDYTALADTVARKVVERMQ